MAVSGQRRFRNHFLEDLKGKTISYQRGATPQMYVLKVLEEAGLSADDVQLVNSTIPEGLSSLSTGAVDRQLLLMDRQIP